MNALDGRSEMIGRRGPDGAMDASFGNGFADGDHRWRGARLHDASREVPSDAARIGFAPTDQQDRRVGDHHGDRDRQRYCAAGGCFRL